MASKLKSLAAIMPFVLGSIGLSAATDALTAKNLEKTKNGENKIATLFSENTSEKVIHKTSLPRATATEIADTMTEKPRHKVGAEIDSLTTKIQSTEVPTQEMVTRWENEYEDQRKTITRFAWEEKKYEGRTMTDHLAVLHLAIEQAKEKIEAKKQQQKLQEQTKEKQRLDSLFNRLIEINTSIEALSMPRSMDELFAMEPEKVYQLTKLTLELKIVTTGLYGINDSPLFRGEKTPPAGYESEDYTYKQGCKIYATYEQIAKQINNKVKSTMLLYNEQQLIDLENDITGEGTLYDPYSADMFYKENMDDSEGLFAMMVVAEIMKNNSMSLKFPSLYKTMKKERLPSITELQKENPSDYYNFAMKFLHIYLNDPTQNGYGK